MKDNCQIYLYVVWSEARLYDVRVFVCVSDRRDYAENKYMCRRKGKSMRNKYNGGHRSVDKAEWMDLDHALCDKYVRDT